MDKKLQSKALILRKAGYSYREISERLEIAKSTARLWTKDQLVSADGKKRISNRLIASQIKAKNILIDKQEKYISALSEKCTVLKNGNIYSKNDYKLFLALLYWAEGSKTEKRLCFTNSDSEMISVYIKLLRLSFEIKEEKISAVLHLHDYHNRAKMIDFWSNKIGIDKKRISIYNKEHSGVRRKYGYMGCISLRYGDYRIFDEIMLIIRRFGSFIV